MLFMELLMRSSEDEDEEEERIVEDQYMSEFDYVKPRSGMQPLSWIKTRTFSPPMSSRKMPSCQETRDPDIEKIAERGTCRYLPGCESKSGYLWQSEPQSGCVVRNDARRYGTCRKPFRVLDSPIDRTGDPESMEPEDGCFLYDEITASRQLLVRAELENCGNNSHSCQNSHNIRKYCYGLDGHSKEEMNHQFHRLLDHVRDESGSKKLFTNPESRLKHHKPRRPHREHKYTRLSQVSDNPHSSPSQGDNHLGSYIRIKGSKSSGMSNPGTTQSLLSESDTGYLGNGLTRDTGSK